MAARLPCLNLLLLKRGKNGFCKNEWGNEKLENINLLSHSCYVSILCYVAKIFLFCPIFFFRRLILKKKKKANQLNLNLNSPYSTVPGLDLLCSPFDSLSSSACMQPRSYFSILQVRLQTLGRRRGSSLLRPAGIIESSMGTIMKSAEELSSHSISKAWV